MPHEIPKISTSFYNIRLGDAATFAVKPRMMTIADDLQDYSIDIRKCYLKNERRLKYFTQYSQSNCEIECVVDMVLEKCGCFLIFIESKTNIDHNHANLFPYKTSRF
jgi:acid-sensing ion channel, other